MRHGKTQGLGRSLGLRLCTLAECVPSQARHPLPCPPPVPAASSSASMPLRTNSYVPKLTPAIGTRRRVAAPRPLQICVHAHAHTRMRAHEEMEHALTVQRVQLVPCAGAPCSCWCPVLLLVPRVGALLLLVPCAGAGALCWCPVLLLVPRVGALIFLVPCAGAGAPCWCPVLLLVPRVGALLLLVPCAIAGAPCWCTVLCPRCAEGALAADHTGGSGPLRARQWQ